MVRRGADALELGFETEDLLIANHLESSLIRQSADTGQPVLQVSSTERAVRSLPAAIIAVPVVASGQVEAVLVLVRDSGAPFTEKERDLLVALAPITATAMQSARHADALAEASLVDGLTGVGNRRRLDTELPEILTRFAGAGSALMMIDLDHFKVVNDRFGHPAGDILLRKVAALLEGQVRPADRVYRYGGEEFSVILPDITQAEAEQVAARVGAAVRDKAFNAGVDLPLRISISIGLAITTGSDAVDLISRADAALYEAKQSGRDRVVVAPSPIDPLTDPDE
jgi:diguanylate cyclase (GGDEF)-like protein